jgi:uncharacterized protein (DUF924 family)
MYKDILKFWFEDIDPKKWWIADPDFDRQIETRFFPILQQAAKGELFSWRTEPYGRLAEIMILDQFSRNIYRKSPLAFAQDAMALVLAQEVIAANLHKDFSRIERSFLYLPLMHSESRAIHQHAEALYKENGLQTSYEFELKHKVIIDRFGRYPHRNEILGRTSTPEELEFLKQPGAYF